MAILRQSFRRSVLTSEEERDCDAVLDLVRDVETRLIAVDDEINRAHVVGAQSRIIQAIVSRILRDELGFREEVVITPQDGLVTYARPDFVRDLGPGRRVMAEVERGGTTTNNHDLKDLWKAHIAPDIQHLVLLVPHTNWRTGGGDRERPFPLVCRRVGAFFGEPRREVDVASCHVFGYGFRTFTDFETPVAVDKS